MLSSIRRATDMAVLFGPGILWGRGRGALDTLFSGLLDTEIADWTLKVDRLRCALVRRGLYPDLKGRFGAG